MSNQHHESSEQQDPAELEAQLIRQKKAGRPGAPSASIGQTSNDPAARDEASTTPGDWLTPDGSIVVKPGAQGSDATTPATTPATATPALTADHGLQVLQGDSAQRPPPASWTIPGAVFAGVVVVGIMALFLLRTPGTLLPATPVATGGVTQPSPETGATPVTAGTGTTATATPTRAPGTPTPAIDPTTTLRSAYAAGLEAYKSQDWEAAAKAYEQARAVNANYLDLPEKLAATYYNWGIALLQPTRVPTETLDLVAAAGERFDLALGVPLPELSDEQYEAISRTHRLATQANEAIDTYRRGVTAQEESNWSESIEAYEQVLDWPALTPLLDTTARLFDAYLERARELASSGAQNSAVELLEKARVLPGADTDEVDNLLVELAPPTPAPRPTAAPTAKRTLKAVPVRDYQGSGNNGTFESCVSGRVTYRGAGIDSAVVGVNNGNVSFRATSGGGGNYRLCGLGASSWSVVLFYIPGSPALANQPVAVVYVNGNRAQEAVVNFTGP